MASVLVQFRTDDKRKEEAIKICETLGIELPDYLRLCLTRLVIEGGLPFSMDAKEVLRLRCLKDLKDSGEEAKKNGTSKLTLKEIDKEIETVREEIRKRWELVLY